MIIKTEEIIFKGPKTKNLPGQIQTLCDIFSYQPDNVEQMPLGNLYIVSELNCVKDCGHLNNLLASLIKREYYLYPSRGILGSFQNAIKKANSHLSGLAKQGNLEWLSKLHFICASIAEENLFLTQVGQTKAFLSRQNHFTSLTRKIIPEPTRPHPSKIFSSIISGKIEAGDKILLATPAIENFFSPSGLRQILINTLTLADTSDQINKILREHKKPANLAVLLLQVQADEPPKNFPNEQIKKNITPPIDLKEILR